MKIMLDNNTGYSKEIIHMIETRKGEVFDFFECPCTELTCDIYLYNSIEDLVKGMKERGFTDMPSYMCACHKDEDNSLNFFEPKKNPLPNEYSKEEYREVIFHELIHTITYQLFGSLDEWLTEGIAKYLDGTYSKGIKYLLEEYIHKQKIPNQKEIEEEFGEHSYDSYDYAYLMVSYLLETKGKHQFLSLLKDKEALEKEKSSLLLKAICYYNKKYFNDAFYNADLYSPQWLYYGSAEELEVISPEQSCDFSRAENTNHTVFCSSSPLLASCYAFKDIIKKNNMNQNFSYEIKNKEEIPVMTMKNIQVDESICGYLYVIVNDGSFEKEENDSLQFRCYHNLIPYSKKKIVYKDFSLFYEIINEKNKVQK